MMATKGYKTDRMNRLTNPTMTKPRYNEHQNQQHEQRAEKLGKCTDLQVFFVLLLLSVD